MEEERENLIPVQEVLNRLETSKATLYSHLKRVKIQTIKRKGRAFIQAEHLKIIRNSLEGLEQVQDSLDSYQDVQNSKDGFKQAQAKLLDKLNESIQSKLAEKDNLIEEHKEQIHFLRSQVSELTETLSNQQKLQLMDKSLLKSMKDEMKELEYINADLEEGNTKEARVFKVVQLSIYFALLITLAAVNYYMTPSLWF